MESGDLPDLTNLLVEWNDNYETNFLYFYHNNGKIYWQTSSNYITDDEKVVGMVYSINEENDTITITTSNNTIEFSFNRELDNNSIISITKKITINNESNSDTHNISPFSYKTPKYTISQVNDKDDAELHNQIYESYQSALSDIVNVMGDDYNSFLGSLGVNQLYFCGQKEWESNTTNNMYTILYVLHTAIGMIIIAGTGSNGIKIYPSLESCT